MTKLEQAARQALDAIGDCSPNKALVHAAYALREALAEQAEQEPVGEVLEGGYEVRLFDRLPEETPLYAAPARTKDLTDDEIRVIEDKVEKWNCGSEKFELDTYDFARAVIAKFKEKNCG